MSGRRRLRHGRSCGTAAQAVLVAGLLTVAGLASACSRVNRHDTGTHTVIVRNQTNPDVLLTGWLGSYNNDQGAFGECANRRSVSLRFTPVLQGFSFVREVTIDGEMYPAYQWSPSSPLVVFSLYNASLTVPEQRARVSVDRVTLLAATTSGHSSTTGNHLRSAFHLRLVSRGGPMTGGKMPALRGTSMLDEHPRAGIVQHQVGITVQVPALPCELSDTSLALPAASAADLLHAGQTAQTRPLDVSMRCPSAGADVSLRLEDVNGSSARAGELMPTRESGATGVHLRVLRDGQPVQFGVPWAHGPRRAGINTIRLEAQYIRTEAALQPGLLRGEARLTADYP